ncbi:MAG: class I SAM-dependent methyltransferase [Nitriliruptorales bacterium]
MSPRASRLNDAELVTREYASEDRFLARRVAFVDYVEGPNAEELAFEAIAAAAPGRLLDVGAGTGAFAERLGRELGVEVVAVDVAPRMVELAQVRGVAAHVADVQDLPFADEAFDCVAALWVLHHVPDLDRGLAEVARVLRPGGLLVAATFGDAHLRELWALVDEEKTASIGFNRETGAASLARRFARVERRDADGVVVFPDVRAVRRFVGATILASDRVDSVPELRGEFRTRSAQCVFLAERPA